MTETKRVRHAGGRPAIGEQINVAMPAALRNDIDYLAAADGISRAEWVRRACAAEVARRCHNIAQVCD